MKKNATLRRTSVFAVTAFLFGAVLTSCNNSGDKSGNGDSSKMNGDSATMMTTPPPSMKDTTDTTHKGGQKAPPANN